MFTEISKWTGQEKRLLDKTFIEIEYDHLQGWAPQAPTYRYWCDWRRYKAPQIQTTTERHIFNPHIQHRNPKAMHAVSIQLPTSCRHSRAHQRCNRLHLPSSTTLVVLRTATARLRKSFSSMLRKTHIISRFQVLLPGQSVWLPKVKQADESWTISSVFVVHRRDTSHCAPWWCVSLYYVPP